MAQFELMDSFRIEKSLFGQRVILPVDGETTGKRIAPVKRSSRQLASRGDCMRLMLNGVLRHYSKRESVVPLASNGLQRSRIQTRFRGEHFEEPAHTLNMRVLAGRIDDRAVTDNVVS